MDNETIFDNSLTTFNGNNKGIGLKYFLKYPKNPLSFIPNMIAKIKVLIANATVVDSEPVGEFTKGIRDFKFD